ncbi:hypothetical protein QYE76_046096 [Lolium multiflorum]|uniref:Uncharacterized protein n=1 Tax=Lolium multiflorum TaxID=4521 RepID=A0AAD8X0S0_LOLMU|nr:hypothetical protein QYE76_046096 [Lolium multiflorum]
MLLGSARTWLNNLPAGSINGWLDFEAAFISNFTAPTAGGAPNGRDVQAGASETDRAYSPRWHGDQPDRRCGSPTWRPCGPRGGWRKPAPKQTDRPWKPKYTFDGARLAVQVPRWQNPSNHSTVPPTQAAAASASPSASPPPPPPGGPGGQAAAEANNLEHHEANQVHHGGRYLAEDATYIIFTSEPEDKTSQQRRSLEVNAVMPPVPQYLNWSEQAITFDRRDTPAVLPKPGSYAMVLDPTLGTTRRSVRFSRVLIDGGSSINILYRDTARKLGIREAELRPTTVFHGIVPGHCCQPIGRITLEVMFGKRTTSARRTSSSRWWTSRRLRAPWAAPRELQDGPDAVIATEKQLIHDAVALAKAAEADMPAVGNPAGTTHFQPADNTKKILLDPAQPDKYVTIGAGLSSK